VSARERYCEGVLGAFANSEAMRGEEEGNRIALTEHLNRPLASSRCIEGRNHFHEHLTSAARSHRDNGPFHSITRLDDRSRQKRVQRRNLSQIKRPKREKKGELEHSNRWVRPFPSIEIPLWATSFLQR
jgi:hypothetical protein